MRIGIQTRLIQGNVTGVGRSTICLLKALAEIDRENEYFLVSHRGGVLPVDASNFKEVVVKMRTGMIPLLMYWEQYKVPAAISKLKLDLYHNPEFIVPRKGNCKKVVTVHDIAPYIFPGQKPWLENYYFTKYMAWHLHYADIILADSESTGKDIINYLKVSPEKVRVVHLGVDQDISPVDDPQRIENVKDKFGIIGDYLFFIGTLEVRKNISNLVKAFDKFVVKTGWDGCLVLAGNPGHGFEDIAATINSAKHGDRVIIAGYLDNKDMAAMYSGATAFVFPSLYEGFGLPVLEAMAYRTPVLTSNVSSLPEVAGDAALMANPESIDDIAAGIEMLTSDSDLRQTLIEKGLARIRQFTWQNTASQVLRIYRDIT